MRSPSGVQQPGLHGFDDPRGVRLICHAIGQAPHREYLIGAKRRIAYSWPVVGIDHIVEASIRLVPEALVEGAEPALEHLAVPAGNLLGDPERVQPERLDLHGLADARRHDPVAHLGVHPGELHSRLTAGEQAVGVEPYAVSSAPAVSVDDFGDRSPQARCDPREGACRQRPSTARM